jgi:arylsulfatase
MQTRRMLKGAPNVLLILLDDVGFGQFSVTGGGVPAPNMDKLAKQGLLYTRFHTTALCSPTRAHCSPAATITWPALASSPN